MGRQGESFGVADERLPSVLFSTDDLEPEGRYETWRGWFREVNEIEIPRDGLAAFSARSEIWRLGPILVSDNRTPARRMRRDRAHCRRDDLDHFMLRVCRDGRISFGDGTAAGPGELAIGNFADGYDYSWSGGDWVGLILPRDADPALGAKLERLPPGRLSGPGPALAAERLLTLAARLPRAGARDAPALAEMTLALAASLVARDPAEAGLSPEQARLSRRRRAERAIRARLGSARLDAAMVCAEARISRSALYRLFEPDGGVMAFVQRLRLDLARRDLADPALAHEPIWRVAERRGLFCVPSFNRAFRRAYGQTPGAARRAARQAEAPRAADAGSGPVTLAGLLR